MFNDSWGVDVAVNTPQLMTALVEEAVEIGDLVRLLTLQTGVSSLVEFTVPHDSHAIGLTVGDIDWPEDSTLVAILRDQAPITPSRDDVIDGGDELFFVTTIAAEDQLRELLSPDPAKGQVPLKSFQPARPLRSSSRPVFSRRGWISRRRTTDSRAEPQPRVRAG